MEFSTLSIRWKLSHRSKLSHRWHILATIFSFSSTQALNIGPSCFFPTSARQGRGLAPSIVTAGMFSSAFL